MAIGKTRQERLYLIWSRGMTLNSIDSARFRHRSDHGFAVLQELVTLMWNWKSGLYRRRRVLLRWSTGDLNCIR